MGVGGGAGGEREPGRVRYGVVDGKLGFLHDAQSMGPGSGAGGEQRRGDGGCGGRGGDVLVGLRYGWEHPATGVVLRGGGAEADLRRSEQVWVSRLREFTGPDRAGNQGRDGQRPGDERHRRARCSGLDVRAISASRLHRRPWSPTSRGCGSGCRRSTSSRG